MSDSTPLNAEPSSWGKRITDRTRQDSAQCRFVLTPQALNAHTDGNRFRRCASAMAVQHGRTSQWFVPVAGSGSRMKV